MTVRNDWAEEIERVLKSEDEDDGEREDDEEERILEAEREGRVVEWCDLESDSEVSQSLLLWMVGPVGEGYGGTMWRAGLRSHIWPHHELRPVLHTESSA